MGYSNSSTDRIEIIAEDGKLLYSLLADTKSEHQNENDIVVPVDDMIRIVTYIIYENIDSVMMGIKTFKLNRDDIKKLMGLMRVVFKNASYTCNANSITINFIDLTYSY